jgi:rhamnogalacturonyl hydrolase YesR
MYFMELIRKVKYSLLSFQRYSWEQGVAMQAFWELGEPDDIEIASKLAVGAAYRETKDGRLAAIGTTEAATDPCAVGEVLLAVAEQHEDARLKKAHARLLDWARDIAPRSQDGIVYHMVDSKQFWVDSFYMLPPFLASAGHYEEALHQLNGYWEALYYPKRQLMGHIWDDDAESFLRGDVWGTGNGWAMAGICRVIDLLPDNMKKEKAELIEKNRELIAGVAQYIHEDGMANDVLDNPASFKDAALPMLLAYSIYRGIYSNWLDDKYFDLAERCRNAALARVDKYGFVREVCGAPHFDKPGISPEAQAFFMLMHAAFKKICCKGCNDRKGLLL